MSTKRFEACVCTDIGRVRTRNEDCGDVWLGSSASRALAMVADGMGGHPGGDHASRSALDRTALAADAGLPGRRPVEWLRQMVLDANRAVRSEQIRTPSHARMATTMVALLATGSSVAVAHLGDSRAYRLRDTRLTQLTTDHTVAQAMLDEGTYRPEDLARSPYRHVLTAGLGLEDEPEPVVARHRSLPGDLYLLCSDGLSNAIPDGEIAEILRDQATLATTATSLIAAANAAGGPDNITVALVRRLY
ncbi:MAG: serine/threonine-protein phosphatase [Ectothiorhodospiraceae bacterium]|nr:serine/threonine-protein phosphatase [Ectothiorhodospiraceae bacterium]MCH8504385.1 protein phosphatase 2C domain-containing protein [Ectothiorhodospiraceae bacterium]